MVDRVVTLAHRVVRNRIALHIPEEAGQTPIRSDVNAAQSAAGSAGPEVVSAEASAIACIPCFSKAAKGPKSLPVGEPSAPRKPVSTSLPTVTMSGITPAAGMSQSLIFT
jgi:hypothetical protein